ncbi:MAG: DMT family transporter [Ilumatobacteraceae bacterium]
MLTARVRNARVAVVDKAHAVPVLGVFLSVLVWGIGPVITLGVDMSINSTIFYRVLFWPIVLYTIIRVRRIPLNWESLRAAVIPGIIFGWSTISGFMSFTTTSIVNATIIGNLSTAMTLLVAPRFLGERLRGVQIVFALTSFAGVAGVVLGAESGGASALRGDVLALINSVLWTGYFIASKKARTSGVNTWAFMFGISVMQCIVAAPWALLTSKDISTISWHDFFLIVTMTLVSGTIGHTTMVWAQRFVPASTSSLICLLSPVISTGFAWMFFGQTVAVIQSIGSFVVLVSLAGVVKYGAKEAVSRDVLSTADPLLNSIP